MQIPRSSACRNISTAFKLKTTRAAFFFSFVCLSLLSPKQPEIGNTSEEGAFKFPDLEATMSAVQGGYRTGRVSTAEPGPRYPSPRRGCGAGSPGPGDTHTGTRAPHGCAPCPTRTPLHSTRVWGFIYLLILLLIFPAKVFSSRPAPSACSSRTSKPN